MQYPLFTQQLVRCCSLAWLAPTPSCAVLRFEPDPADADLANGVVLPWAPACAACVGSSDIRCDFQTGGALQLLPCGWPDAQYTPPGPRPCPSCAWPERPASSLRIELELMGDADPLDSSYGCPAALRDQLSDAWGSQLMELLGGRCVKSAHRPAHAQRQALVRPARSATWALRKMRPCCATRSGATGFRILKEYAALPDKFRFVELSGLRQALARFRGRKLYLHLLFSGSFNKLESAVKAEPGAVLRAGGELARTSAGPGRPGAWHDRVPALWRPHAPRTTRSSKCWMWWVAVPAPSGASRRCTRRSRGHS